MDWMAGVIDLNWIGWTFWIAKRVAPSGAAVSERVEACSVIQTFCSPPQCHHQWPLVLLLLKRCVTPAPRYERHHCAALTLGWERFFTQMSARLLTLTSLEKPLALRHYQLQSHFNGGLWQRDGRWCHWRRRFTTLRSSREMWDMVWPLKTVHLYTCAERLHLKWKDELKLNICQPFCIWHIKMNVIVKSKFSQRWQNWAKK